MIVIPLHRSALSAGPTDGPWAQREASLQRIRKVGRREWQKESGYRQHARGAGRPRPPPVGEDAMSILPRAVSLLSTPWQRSMTERPGHVAELIEALIEVVFPAHFLDSLTG